MGLFFKFARTRLKRNVSTVHWACGTGCDFQLSIPAAAPGY